MSRIDDLKAEAEYEKALARRRAGEAEAVAKSWWHRLLVWLHLRKPE